MENISGVKEFMRNLSSTDKHDMLCYKDAILYDF